MRIVSLLPSATEIICGIGLTDSLVGISHECDFPESIRQLPRVTRTRIATEATGGQIDSQVRSTISQGHSLFSLDQQLLRELRPDLVITQELCGACAVGASEVEAAVCELGSASRIIQLKPQCFEDLFSEIEMVGEEANAKRAASEFVLRLRRRVDSVRVRARSISRRPRIVLLEWLEPLFSAGHWNPELVEIAGGEEILGHKGGRSREIHRREFLEADPDIVVIACCGMQIQQAMKEWSRVREEPWWNDLRSVRDGRVFLLDGAAYFNRPGPRLVDSIEILANVLNSEC